MTKEAQRGFFGIIIPKEILDDQELNVTEKFIYGYVASFTRCCYESNEMIAAKLGISESTVKHAIPKLVNKGYFYVDKVNNNNASRRIYSVLDNPKKLAYLAKKGMFKVVENSDGSSAKNALQNEGLVQNLHEPVQNMHYSKTGVSSAKFAHKEKEEKENKEKCDEKVDKSSAGLAGERPASRLITRRECSDDDEFEKAFYKQNTFHLSAI